MEHVVTIVTNAATPTAVVRETTTWDAFPTRWRALLDEVWAFVRREGLTAGRNVMVYADDVPNVEVGVEVSEAFSPGERVMPSVLPAGKGRAYDQSRTAHAGGTSRRAHRGPALVRCERRADDRRALGGLRALAR